MTLPSLDNQSTQKHLCNRQHQKCFFSNIFPKTFCLSLRSNDDFDLTWSVREGISHRHYTWNKTATLILDTSKNNTYTYFLAAIYCIYFLKDKNIAYVTNCFVTSCFEALSSTLWLPSWVFKTGRDDDRDIKLTACSFYMHVGPSYVKSSCAEQHLRTVTVTMNSPAKFLFWSILNQMWSRDIFSSTSIQSNFFCKQWIRPLLAVIKKVDQGQSHFA